MMSSNPKISIITVSLNSARTIERTIQSVIRQRYDNKEYIIIDGKSEDGTVDIIKKYEEYIDCWISERDNGIYEAMNKGIERASGDYIQFINSDDWLEDDAIEIAVNYIKCFHADVFYSDVCVVHSSGQYIQMPLSLEMFYWLFPFGHQGTLIRNNGNMKFDENYVIASDYKLLLQLYYEKKKFCYIPKTLAYYSSGGVSDRREYLCGIETCDVAADMMLKYGNREEFMYKEKIYESFFEAEVKKELSENASDSIFADYICNKLGKRKKSVFLGCGINANAIVPPLIKRGIDFLYAVDKNSEKQSEMCYGLQVYSYEKIREEKNINILITIQNGYLQAMRYIKEMNLSMDISVYSYVSLKEECKQYLRDNYLEKAYNKIPCFRELFG